jgi:hypothetical protein
MQTWPIKSGKLTTESGRQVRDRLPFSFFLTLKHLPWSASSFYSGLPYCPQSWNISMCTTMIGRGHLWATRREIDSGHLCVRYDDVCNRLIDCDSWSSMTYWLQSALDLPMHSDNMTWGRVRPVEDPISSSWSWLHLCHECWGVFTLLGQQVPPLGTDKSSPLRKYPTLIPPHLLHVTHIYL